LSFNRAFLKVVLPSKNNGEQTLHFPHISNKKQEKSHNKKTSQLELRGFIDEDFL
jgi:hypothetical protein